MLLLLLAHAVAAVLVPLAAGRHGRVAAGAAALLPAATAVWALSRAAEVSGGAADTERLAWAPGLGLILAFRLDALALVMLVLVGGVGAAVLAYCAGYFRPVPRLTLGVLVAFAGAMTGLVLADNVFALYVFWELTTVCSFVLIGGARPADEESRRAATQALLTTTGFGLVMLGGLVLLGQAAGTYEISAMVANPPGGPAATAGLVLVLLGAFAKSAQPPLHAWLPAAMVAPTPVSAYLHAAAMVKAGVYLVARLAPGFAGTAGWQPLVVTVGLVGLVGGGWRALCQDDLKRLLAYGTVSQLGLLMVLFGSGTRGAALAGTALLLAHGLFKAPMFLAVGVLDRELGTRRAARLTGVGRRLPVLAVTATGAAASMIGLPPFLGYVAKEGALAAFETGGAGALAVLAGVVAGSVLTVAYGARFVQGAFGGRAGSRAGENGDPLPGAGRHRTMVVPVVVLSAAGLAGGLVPGLLQRLAGPYVRTLPPHGAPYELSLWPGLGGPLALSALILAAGLGLHLARRRVDAFRAALPRGPDAQRGYDAAVRGVFRFARAVTRRTQVGSVPAYLAVIGATVLAVPGVALVAGLAGGGVPLAPSGLRLWDNPAQAVLGAVAVAGAVPALRVRGRLSAVLVLAASGFAVGGLFVVQGGPDLALTLFVVETLSLIMLVFVLRRLPPRFPPRRRRRRARAAAAAISAGMGALVAAFLLVASLTRHDAPVGPRYTQAVHGKGAVNIVDAILVDLRALDTLGEIAVLAAATAGVAGLVTSGAAGRSAERRAGRRRRRGTAPQEETAAPPEPAPQRETTETPQMHARPEPPAPPEPAPPPERAPPPETALGPPRRGRALGLGRPAFAPRSRWLAAPGRPPIGPRSVLLEATTRVLAPTIMLFSIYLLLAGHSRPGGGFVGGLVAGMAFVLRYVAGGRAELRAAVSPHPSVLVGAGLVLAAGTGVVDWTAGRAEPGTYALSGTVPPVGHVELPLTLPFDAGVYLLVLGLVLTVVATLGGGLEPPADEGGRR